MLSKEQLATLHEVMTAKDIYDFEKYGTLYVSKKKETDCFVFKEGSPKSKVLAVAHTDWVHERVWNYGYGKMVDEGDTEPKISLDGRTIYGRQLDDRLGAWIILHLLPTLLPANMPYDILLTDQEETGNSTASFFWPGEREDQPYNWMFEFDRHGLEVVMYGYETPPLKKLIKEYEFPFGQGSFTDIGYLSHLKCAGFNIGTGYYNEHCDSCHAVLDDTFLNVERFVKFYHDMYNTLLPSKFYSSRSQLDKPPKTKKLPPSKKVVRGTVITGDTVLDDDFMSPSQDQRIYKLWQFSGSTLSYFEWRKVFNEHREKVTKGEYSDATKLCLVGEGDTDLSDWDIEQFIRYGDFT